MEEKELTQKCMCKKCPSFVNCNEKTAFCMTLKDKQKSSCIKIEQGCVCPMCPVQTKLNLGYVYYCIRGSEKSQKIKKM